jgi:hypothetical protein
MATTPNGVNDTILVTPQRKRKESTSSPTRAGEIINDQYLHFNEKKKGVEPGYIIIDLKNLQDTNFTKDLKLFISKFLNKPEGEKFKKHILLSYLPDLVKRVNENPHQKLTDLNLFPEFEYFSPQAQAVNPQAQDVNLQEQENNPEEIQDGSQKTKNKPLVTEKIASDIKKIIPYLEDKTFIKKLAKYSVAGINSHFCSTFIQAATQNPAEKKNTLSALRQITPNILNDIKNKKQLDSQGQQVKFPTIWYKLSPDVQNALVKLSNEDFSCIKNFGFDDLTKYFKFNQESEYILQSLLSQSFFKRFTQADYLRNFKDLSFHLVGKIRKHKYENVTAYLIKQDFDEPLIADKVTIPYDRALNANAIKKNFPDFLQPLAASIYQLLRLRTRASENVNAIRETIATQVACELQMRVHTQKILHKTYADNYPKLCTQSTWEKSIQPLAEEGAQEIIGGDYSAGNYLAKYDAQTQIYRADDTILDLGAHYITAILQGDRDFFGSKGDNKTKIPLDSADKKTYNLFGIDFGQAYRKRNPLTPTLQDNFSFKQPSFNTYKNFSIFEDTLLSEKMKGVYKLRKIATGQNPPEHVLAEYSQEFHTEIEKIEVSKDLKVFEKYKHDYSEKMDGATSELEKEAYRAIIQGIEESKRFHLEARNQILRVFDKRLKLSPSELDLVDNLEKLTSASAVTSPDGKILLNHIRVLPDKRIAWQLKRPNKSSKNYCLHTSLSSTKQAKQIAENIIEYLAFLKLPGFDVLADKSCPLKHKRAFLNKNSINIDINETSLSIQFAEQHKTHIFKIFDEKLIILKKHHKQISAKQPLELQQFIELRDKLAVYIKHRKNIFRHVSFTRRRKLALAEELHDKLTSTFDKIDKHAKHDIKQSILLGLTDKLILDKHSAFTSIRIANASHYLHERLIMAIDCQKNSWSPNKIGRLEQLLVPAVENLNQSLKQNLAINTAKHQPLKNGLKTLMPKHKAANIVRVNTPIGDIQPASKTQPTLVDLSAILPPVAKLCEQHKTQAKSQVSVLNTPLPVKVPRVKPSYAEQHAAINTKKKEIIKQFTPELRAHSRLQPIYNLEHKLEQLVAKGSSRFSFFSSPAENASAHQVLETISAELSIIHLGVYNRKASKQAEIDEVDQLDAQLKAKLAPIYSYLANAKKRIETNEPSNPVIALLAEISKDKSVVSNPAGNQQENTSVLFKPAPYG